MSAIKSQLAEAASMTATVSSLLRKEIAAVFPVAGDQYLTVAIPGTVIDTFNDGSFVWTATKDAKLPPLDVSKRSLQAVWMDWVVNVYKYEAEDNFGIVDVKAIMARAEDSKEALRNSTVSSDNGSERLAVELTPRNWATLCQEEIRMWNRVNGSFSSEQVVAAIKRLTQLQISLKALQASKYPHSGSETTPPDLKEKMQDAYKAMYENNNPPPSPATSEGTATGGTPLTPTAIQKASFWMLRRN
ncbi:hypothetical protein M427DRAFT_29530 [Gonapodya prolifera JEL478]|uniref:Uncharacterized protein n=1 Tax=Gonapodya prolifera (strain JEL478) TaxID=1344416 RepID=A0A139APN8_GONPJ|nr:hypothetical protein M427DRAFT_29530 [Gonapodya prolifera JEL478]|eukprot:KXS18614.1 hypothetical protein M427DRAFT_29530 [Gonapodya prolifera JEL478]